MSTSTTPERRHWAAFFAGLLPSLLAALRRPDVQTDLLQIAKAVLAAVGAWLIADQVLGMSQSFLASWAALLTVHATVYRSLSRGAQSVAATLVGLVVSFAVAQLLGAGALTIGVALLAGMLLSRLGVLRHEGVTVATTALFVLTTAGGTGQTMLLDRLLETGVGVAAGILVNLLVLPPLNHRSAERQLDRLDRQMGGLMSDMASEMARSTDAPDTGTWIERTRRMDEDLSHAWQLVSHARESEIANIRRRPWRDDDDAASYEEVLRRVEDGVSHLRAIARTVDESTRVSREWDDRFRQPWLDILADTAARIADPDADVEAMRDRIDALTRELSQEDLPGLLWPMYGALITNLRNVVQTVDDVASARPVRP